MHKYTVRYGCDGYVTRIHFVMPAESSARQIVEKAAALLFLHDCCPGEDFCCYRDDDRRFAVVSDVHRYYADTDVLWATADDIQDIWDL